MNPGEQNTGKGFGIGPVRWGAGESIATVKVGVEVVSLRGSTKGQSIWSGEAKGEQSSQARSVGVDVGLFSYDGGKSTSPTLDDAMELCVMDLVKQLADRVPTLSGATVSAAPASAPAAEPARS
jgi:hypothetical protein